MASTIEKAKARLRAGVDGEQLQAACRNLSRAFGVKIEPRLAGERLSNVEALDLIELGRKLTTAPAGMGDVFGPSAATFEEHDAERAAAREFAQFVRGQKGDEARKWTRELLAEHVERSGKLPTLDEIKVFTHAGRGETHETLRPKIEAIWAKDGGWVSGGRVETFNPGALSEEERLRLEASVEKAIDRAGYFEAKREDAKMARKLRAALDKLKPGPRERRYAAEAGSVQIPAEFYAGMLAGDKQHLGLTVVDLACFGFVCFALENRALPGLVAKQRHAGFEGPDQNMLLVKHGILPFGYANVAGADRELLSRKDWEDALKALHSAGWLLVEWAKPGGDGLVRISRGPQYVKWLEQREEVR